MRLEYITPKKDYNLKSHFIFDNDDLLKDAEEIMKIRSPKKQSNEINKLLKKYKIDKDYKDEILYFIKNNGWHNADHAFDKNGLIIKIPKTKRPIDHYFLRIGPNTKLNDLRDAFNMMKDYFKKPNQERNRKKIFPKRDLLIFRLAKAGLCCEQIQKTIVNIIKLSEIEAIQPYQINIHKEVDEMLNELPDDIAKIYKKDGPKKLREILDKKLPDGIYETTIRTALTDLCDKLKIPKKERPRIHSEKMRDKGFLAH